MVVVLALGALLTVFGGTVRTPRFEMDAQGQRQRVFETAADGEKAPAFDEKNKFLNAQHLIQLAKDTSFIAVMAIGATFVIVAGGIDLSVGSIYALASVLGALVLHAHGPGAGSAAGSAWMGTLLGVVVCVGTGLACGLANGALIVRLRVHPFIITLGSMAILRGLAFVVTQGQSVGEFPGTFRNLVRWETSGGLAVVPLAVMVLAAIGAAFYLRRTVAGRRIYAVGGNETASRFSGLPVERVKLGVYAWSGFAAGLAAVLAIGYYGSASSGDGAGYELDVIAAAVVGGASLSGGAGTAWGALLGALVIKMIDAGIVILGIDQNYSRIIIGAAVIVAVVFDQWNVRRRARRAEAAARPA